jgi:hypothetical protein
MFSVPLNPKLTEKDFNNFVEFLLRNKSYIFDFYFTCRIPPFTQDAMGDTFIGGEDDHDQLIKVALHLQEITGITASAVFNNIEVRPDQKNLDLFIENFRPIYESGIKSITIPHTHWAATGQIKANFPDIFIKNTILRNVSEPRDIEKLAEAGFDYINLDRNLMRDRDRLLRFKKAKEKYGVKLSLLANEGCAGGCIMMGEHYQFNNTRTPGSPQYFNDPISRVSCPMWDAKDAAMPLKTANFAPWREDWQEYLDDLGIDVIKMHGRESVNRLKETMDIIDRYVRNEEILFDGFNDFIEETNLVDKPIDVWRNKIKNCKFDCWDCGFCDKIVKAKYGQPQNELVLLTTDAIMASGIPTISVDIPGLTSPRVQTLLNTLVKNTGSYLEVGSYLGATGVAALTSNINIDAYFVDHWQQDITPVTADEVVVVENKKEQFIANIKTVTEGNSVTVFDCDMFAVNTSKINGVKIFFYDGPHDFQTTSKAVQYFAPTLAETSILVFDDANWAGVIEGAKDGILKSNLQTIYTKALLNDIESTNEWWNGLFIAVVKKDKKDKGEKICQD